MTGIGKLIVELPLIVALLIIVRDLSKTLKVHPWGQDEKDDAKTFGKAIVYLIAAGILMWWLAPPLGVLGTIFGFLITITFALLVVIAVDTHKVPARVDALAWRDGWKNPWRRSGNPVPYVRWARRFTLLLLLVFLLGAALVAALTPDTPPAQADGSSNSVIANPTTTQPTAPATAAPQDTDTTAAPSTDDSAPAQKYVDNSCNGPKQIPTVAAKNIKFDTVTGDMKICYSGQWQKWSAFATTPPPKTVQLKAWTVDGAYGYGQVIDASTGDDYVVRTSDFF